MEDTDESDPPSASEDSSENDEAETTQINNSSLLEKTDIENKMTEIPPVTIIQNQKPYTERFLSGKFNKNHSVCVL